MQIPNKLRHSRNVQTISEITCENEDEFQLYVLKTKIHKDPVFPYSGKIEHELFNGTNIEGNWFRFFFDNSGANIVVEFVTEQKADSDTSNEVKSGWRRNVLLVTQTRLCSFVLNESLQHQ